MIALMEQLVSIKKKGLAMRKEDLNLKRRMIEILDHRQRLKASLPAVEQIVNLISDLND